MLEALIAKMARLKMLEADDVRSALESIMGGKCATDEIVQWLERAGELPVAAPALAAGARVMRQFSVKLPKDWPQALDTCGTGGDFSGSINVSTLAAFVLASGGVPVAKHGNRSHSGVCGSADLLEGLGVRIDLTPQRVADCLDKTGFGFMFAPQFHPAMRHAVEARKRLRHKTIFNLLGPLSNPASAAYQIVGIYNASLIPVYLEALRDLGSIRAMVFCGRDGMDEISLCAPTLIGRLEQGEITSEVFDPLTLGIERAAPEALKVASKDDAIYRARQVLSGTDRGAAMQIVALNAAAGFYVKKTCPTIAEGYEMAKGLLLQGKAQKKLEQIIEVCKRG